MSTLLPTFSLRQFQISRFQVMAAAISILLLGINPLGVNAATIPTPAPGNASPVTAPNPNPLQYNAMSGTTIKSNDYNSSFYKSYADLGNVIGSLNGCGYVPGAAVSTITASSPLAVSGGACSPGNGSTINVSFSAVGQALNVGSLSATSSVTSPLYQTSNATGANYSVYNAPGCGVVNRFSNNTGVGALVQNVYASADGMYCAGPGKTIYAINGNGDAGFLNSVNTNYVNATVNGAQNGLWPLILNGQTTASTTTYPGAHSEMRTVAMGNGSGISQTTFSFAQAFDQAPVCVATTVGSNGVSPSIYGTTTGQVTLYGASNQNVTYFCAGL